MRRQRRVLQSTAAGAMQEFLDYHHALGKRFDNEAWALNLFDRYLVEQEVEALTADGLCTVLRTGVASERSCQASPPRRRLGSFCP
jgi:hypothetical protein